MTDAPETLEQAKVRIALLNDAHLAAFKAKEAEKRAKDEAAQRKANDTGYPHPLNGRCQAERPNMSNDFAGPCNAPLHAFRDRVADGTNPPEPNEGTYCGLLGCPDYDLPKPAQPGITLRFPEPPAPTPADPTRCSDGCALDFEDGKPVPCDPHDSIGPYVDDSDAPGITPTAPADLWLVNVPMLMAEHFWTEAEANATLAAINKAYEGEVIHYAPAAQRDAYRDALHRLRVILHQPNSRGTSRLTDARTLLDEVLGPLPGMPS